MAGRIGQNLLLLGMQRSLAAGKLASDHGKSKSSLSELFQTF
jgi:hypothetical protein